MMKQVIKFESDDGAVFDTEADAVAHDNLDALREWYEEHKLYGMYEGCRIEWDDLLEWCQQNKGKLEEILIESSSATEAKEENETLKAEFKILESRIKKLISGLREIADHSSRFSPAGAKARLVLDNDAKAVEG